VECIDGQRRCHGLRDLPRRSPPRTTTGATTYSDTAVVSTTTYQYQVRARDAAVNVSDFSNTATVTTPDGIPPSAPSGLTASAVSTTRIDLSWNASTDNVGVTGYEIFRNGTLLATWGIFEAYSDKTVSPSTTYQYQVRARDQAGNRSEFSNTATATTPSGTPIRTFYSLADTYSKADEPDRNFGTSGQIRVDASPDVRAFLRFDPDGLGAPVTRAILRVYANSANSIGIHVRGVADSLWGETTLTHRNMPPVGSVMSSSGPITANTWLEWEVTSLLSGDDPVSFALTTTSATATSLASRETGFTRPELVITYG
jgi:chitodextrinase